MTSDAPKIDISREAVDALSARLRGQDAIPNRTEVAAHVDALRAALDEAEGERDAANALLRKFQDHYPRGVNPFLDDVAIAARAHLGAKP